MLDEFIDNVNKVVESFNKNEAHISFENAIKLQVELDRNQYLKSFVFCRFTNLILEGNYKMSRYSEILPDGSELSWGYDRPLSSYFIQKQSPNEELLFDVGNRASLKAHPDYPGKLNFSNSELLEIFNGYSEFIPAHHIQALSLDLEF